MPLSQIAVHLPPFLTYLLPLLLLAPFFKSAKVKGLIGELLARFAAYLHLDQKTYRRLHNVTLDTPDGTTQIDHVFLSPYGIFVLETKNMGGWIFGSEGQAQWTQKLYKRSFKFQNPLRQNYKHVKALEAALGLGPEQVYSVVTFVGGSTFKTDMPANVTQGAGFVRYIRNFQQRVFSEAQVDAMVEALQTGRRAPTRAAHQEHVQRLKQRANPAAQRLCPKCGSALVIRTVKAGVKAGQPFWGCSAFPKCRVMQGLSKQG